VNAALQSGLVFLLLHSLRWEDSKHDGLRIVRIIACAGWLLHSYLWTFSGDALWMPCIFGSAVLAIYLVVQLFRGGWDHHALPITATLVVLSSPVNALAGEVSSTPIGLLAVIGSFVLFGLGTATALMKHRWASNQ
jgi:hypothetical protein